MMIGQTTDVPTGTSSPGSCTRIVSTLQTFPARAAFSIAGGIAWYYRAERPKSGFWRYIVGSLIGTLASHVLVAGLAATCPEPVPIESEYSR
jgi:hypothetical protein